MLLFYFCFLLVMNVKCFYQIELLVNHQVCGRQDILELSNVKSVHAIAS